MRRGRIVTINNEQRTMLNGLVKKLTVGVSLADVIMQHGIILEARHLPLLWRPNCVWQSDIEVRMCNADHGAISFRWKKSSTMGNSPANGT